MRIIRDRPRFLLSYEPWGKRRNADWSDAAGQLYASHTKRSFTGHEYLEDAGLIHMNGRVYDPDTGRMLSPDPFINQPANTQSYNRYSYVLNNPLSYTDPSGYMEEITIHGTRLSSPDLGLGVVFLVTNSSSTNLSSNVGNWFAPAVVAVNVYTSRTGSHIKEKATVRVPVRPLAARTAYRESGDTRGRTLSAEEYAQVRKWLEKSYNAIFAILNSNGRVPWPANGHFILNGHGLSPAPGPDGALGLNKLRPVNPILGSDMLEGTIVIYSGGAVTFQELFLTLAHELAHFDDSWSHAQQEWYARELWKVYNGGSYGEMPDRTWCPQEDYMTCF